jgi:hypothetical protein
VDSVEVFLIALCLPAAVASGSDARRVRSQSQRLIGFHVKVESSCWHGNSGKGSRSCKAVTSVTTDQ